MSTRQNRTEGQAPAGAPTSRVGKDSDAWLPDQVAAVAGGPGARVRIRQAAASDRPALTQMLARCSEQTRARRFHTYVHRFPEPYLTEALSGRPGHFALLAQAGEREVALASCVAADLGSADHGSAEVAVLVEDSWQRAGVGARLLSLLVAHADRCGLPRLKATVLASQSWMLPVLGGYGTCEAWLRGGVFEVTVHRKDQ
jgi:N-acetylglutamate synthase-like GNAT family acetyltransferase